MKPGFFIDRPVFSIVISILIVLLGAISIFVLPINQYPDITPPSIRVSASYSGANANTVIEAIATPLEQELNGSPGMLYMESNSSSSGSLDIVVTFEVGTSPDLAAVEIQNRVKLAESRLPAEVIKNGIKVEQMSSNLLMTVSVSSDNAKYDEIYLSNYATINLIDEFKRIPGIGKVSNLGSRYYGMRIWIYPDRLAGFGLTVKDIQTVLKDQNKESAAGELGLQPIDNLDVSIPINAPGRLSTADEFGNIVVRANADGSIIRLKDIAEVKLEASYYNTASGINNENAAILNLFLLPGANALNVAKQVRTKLAELEKSFPEGIAYDIPFDMTEFITASIKEVIITLIQALVLVVLVVFLSLQNWRATLIPIIAVPISLIGTFTVMLAFGFSINMLTLLGLILAIGIVVDDAIVVVENVERLMADGLSAREATHSAMKELSGALVATSLVLAAVFVPVSFLSGMTGVLYRQFSITIAVSVVISTIVALTLSPALCAILLKQRAHSGNWLFRKVDEVLDYSNNKYLEFISFAISKHKRVIAAFGILIIFIFLFFRFIPTSFIPEEDQGKFMVEIELPEGATLDRTMIITQKAVEFLKQQPAVAYVQHVDGSSNRVGGSQNRSVLTVMLKHWDERDDDEMSVDAVMERTREEFQLYPEAKFYYSKPAIIPGLGSSGGFEMQLQARSGASLDMLESASDTLIYYAKQQKEIHDINSGLQANVPQLYLDIDKDKVLSYGIPLADVFSTMNTFLASSYVNDFNMFNRIYRVYIQADEKFRRSQSNLDLFYVKTNTGAMVPISALGKLEYMVGPGSLKRFNMFKSSVIRGEPSISSSSGAAMNELEEIVSEKLPPEIGLNWSGLSFQEKQTEGQIVWVIILVFIFVFLFLAALYESWLYPLSVILSLPIAVFGALLGIWIIGLKNDIYFQIGLISLIGLASKNAILIVEVAKQQIDEGVEIIEAIMNAAKLRFRPIVMTSLAFVLGMLPLVLASGPGSASRQSVGTGVLFGMMFSISLGIIMVPFFIYIIFKTKAKLLKRK